MVRRSRLAAEALGALLVADARVRIRSRRRAARLLGMVASGPAMAPDEASTAEALRVARAVARIARWLPWHPKCLAQAIAVRWMLKRRGIACRAHLGMVSARPPAAHAWVTVGQRVVIGGGVRASELGAFV